MQQILELARSTQSNEGLFGSEQGLDLDQCVSSTHLMAKEWWRGEGGSRANCLAVIGCRSSCPLVVVVSVCAPSQKRDDDA